MGSLSAFSTKNVATFAGQQYASQMVTQLGFNCWSDVSPPWSDPNKMFTINVPRETHWPNFQSYFGYSIDDDQHRADGFSNISLS